MEKVLDAKELIYKLSRVIHLDQMKSKNTERWNINLHTTTDHQPTTNDHQLTTNDHQLTTTNDKEKGEEYFLKLMEEKNLEMRTRILIVESKLSRLETELTKYKEGNLPKAKRIG